MNRYYRLAVGMAVAMVCAGAHAEWVHMSTPSSSLLLDAPDGGNLRIMHYGSPLTDSDLGSPAAAGNDIRLAYPAYCDHRPELDYAISRVMPDGNMPLYLLTLIHN